MDYVITSNAGETYQSISTSAGKVGSQWEQTPFVVYQRVVSRAEVGTFLAGVWYLSCVTIKMAFQVLHLVAMERLPDTTHSCAKTCEGSLFTDLSI